MSTLARWARKFGVARAVCLVLLFALVPLRIWIRGCSRKPG